MRPRLVGGISLCKSFRDHQRTIIRYLVFGRVKNILDLYSCRMTSQEIFLTDARLSTLKHCYL